MSLRRIEKLADLAWAICRERGWRSIPPRWEMGSANLHLEVSELIEAVRGKHGNPIEEAGDVLFVLLSIIREYDLDLEAVVAHIEQKATANHRDFLGG